MESGSSYRDFMEMYRREQICNNEIDEATGGDEEDETSSSAIEEDSKLDMVSKLCRCCGNRGQIYIHSVACDKYLTIPKSRLTKFKEVTIAEMIEKISSEKVEKSDNLPQFICPHCLSYLQHAYNIRLQIIHTSENLKEAIKIANDEEIVLEANPANKPLSQNQQEINNTKEEINEEKYWFETFDKKKAKIKIQTTTRDRIEQRKAEEIKCPGCFRKSYGAKSHNQHMQSCIINLLKIFFGEFQILFKARFEKKVTQEEYLINAISLIFNYQKKIEALAKNQDIDVEAISKVLPALPNLQDFTPTASSSKTNAFGRANKATQDRFAASPADNGYYSNTQ